MDPQLAARLDRLDKKLDRILSFQGMILQAIGLILTGETEMAGELQQLTDQVKQNTDVEGSAVTLLQGLKQKLDDAIASGDPVQLKALSDALGQSATSLAAAVVANTPVAPPPPPPPPAGGRRSQP